MKKIIPIILLSAIVMFALVIQEKSDILQTQENKLPELRYDGPAQYAKMHNYIRTLEGETRPNYKFGDKLKAFEKHVVPNTKKSTPLNWVDRGPANVGGRTRGLLIDYRDTTLSTWFGASVGGGIWKTEDAGQSWRLLTPDFPNLATSTIANSAANPDVIYVGTGEGFPNFESIAGVGMFKSYDNGESWELLTSTAGSDFFENVLRIIVNPADENEVLICTRNETDAFIFKSTDGGASWLPKFGQNFNAIQQIAYAPTDFNIQYGTVNSVGIIKSVDAGETWQLVYDAGPEGFERMELAISPNDPNVVYVSCDVDDNSRLLYTRDGFATTNLSVFVDFEPAWLGSQGWYDNTIAVHPYNDSIVWVAGAGPMIEIQPSGDSATIRRFDGFENNTDFLEEVGGNQFVDESAGTTLDLLDGLPVPTNTTQEDIVEVEVRFGPGLSSKAHLIETDLFNYEFNYISMIDVPFVAWDTENDRQVSISIFDNDVDSAWTYRRYEDSYDFADVVFIHMLDYTETPDPMIQFGNAFHKSQYYWILQRPENVSDTLTQFPEGNILFETRFDQGLEASFTAICDGYNQYTDFTFVGTKGVHVDHHNIIFVPKDTVAKTFYVLNANDGGIAFSDDSGASFFQTGSSFSQGGFFESSLGYNASQWYGIDKMNGGSRYVGGTQDNGSWVSGYDPREDSEWVEAPSGDGFEAVWKYNDTLQIIESSQRNNIYKSTDGGLSWRFLDVPGGEGPFFTRVEGSQINPDLIFMVATEGVLRSDDFGDNFEVIEMPDGWNYQRIWGPPVRVSLVDANIVWSGGGVSAANKMCVSTDAGLSFTSVNDYDDATLGPVVNITADPVDPNTAYVVFAASDAPKILKTTDLGQSWTDISGFVINRETSNNGFPNVATYCVIVMPWNTNHLWAGTDIGIFESLDGGETWAYADTGFPAASVFAMKIVNNELLVATHGRGIWTLDTAELEDTRTIDVNDYVSNVLVYPNPTSSQATIKMVLKEKSKVVAKLYDLQGRLVKDILNSNLNEGSHAFNLDRTGINAGQYRISIQTEFGLINRAVTIM